MNIKDKAFKAVKQLDVSRVNTIEFQSLMKDLRVEQNSNFWLHEVKTLR